MLRTAGLHPPYRKARPCASTPRSPQTPAGYYEGDLVPPSAGLPPASHRELFRTHAPPKPLVTEGLDGGTRFGRPAGYSMTATGTGATIGAAARVRRSFRKVRPRNTADANNAVMPIAPKA
jgi:hypothetical protein